MANPKKDTKEDKVKEAVASMEKLKEAPVQETSKLGDKDYNKEDAEYKVSVIEDYYGAVDVLHLNREDPRYKYRWLNEKPENLTVKTSNVLADKGGWQLCPRKHLVDNLGIDSRKVSADGLYRAGSDLVLAFMPKELHQKKEEFKKRRSNERMSGVDQRLKKGDPSVEREHGGLQTAKQLGLK